MSGKRAQQGFRRKYAQHKRQCSRVSDQQDPEQARQQELDRAPLAEHSDDVRSARNGRVDGGDDVGPAIGQEHMNEAPGGDSQQDKNRHCEWKTRSEIDAGIARQKLRRSGQPRGGKDSHACLLTAPRAALAAPRPRGDFPA